MRQILFCLGFALLSCTPTIDGFEGDVTEPTEVLRDAILGGTLNTGDPEVFLLILSTSQGQSICTGTLIDRRTILTAAHCLDGVTTAYASNATSQDQLVPGVNTYRIIEKRIHPGWNPALGLDNDIGVGFLDRAPPVTPKQWNQASLSGLAGTPLRATGYGTSGNGVGSGTKRKVDLTIRSLTSSLLFLGDGVSKGICHGDSGGPSFRTFPDGVERVIGVHSFTRGEACLDGADSRTDFPSFKNFIQTWLTEKEAPSCLEDGRCVMGCGVPDIDCFCKTDGVCNAQCPDLLKDTDCPPHCIPNGICSIDACPVPDVDCRPVGESCSGMNQCVSRKCVTDPQHPANYYCASPCSAGCPTGFECAPAPATHCQKKQLPTAEIGETCTVGGTYCGAAALCGEKDGVGTCAFACDDAIQCQNGFRCVQGSNTRFCEAIPKPPIVIQKALTEGGIAPSGCSSFGSLSMLALGALLRRRTMRS